MKIKEYLNISNPEDLQTDPVLVIIRMAIDECWDKLYVGDDVYNYQYHRDSAIRIANLLGNNIEIDENGDPLELSAEFMTYFANDYCYDASIFVKTYLEEFYPERFACNVLVSNKTKYFGRHFVAIIKDLTTGFYYLTSPSNPLNLDEKPPKRNTRIKFDRMRNVIRSRNAMYAIKKLEQIEGGVWRKLFRSYEDEINIVES